ncbi:MAG: hypothetical protein LAN37_00885 [Acidobacteriia bacterium]|nr:hypothetical protein [Terriglobia bacterium]
MNLHDANQKAEQILDQERVEPTVRYEMAPTETVIQVLATFAGPLKERGKHPRTIQERPEQFQFKSTNFDLLCAILDQVPSQNRPAFVASVRSRISDARSYRRRYVDVLGAGSWKLSSSELPLVAEFLVRRGDKQVFIRALSEAAPGPGLTLLLMQLEEMIALNFTLFTDEEYQQLPTAIESIRTTVAGLSKGPKPSSTVESNTLFHVRKEIPELCDSILEGCRKARYLYVISSLLPGMNLEVNQDKSRVRTFLEKLGFAQLLIESLEEAERLYRTAATPFELKSGMGHLRSFLEQLHLQACALAHKKLGGCLPSTWGEALKYLRDQNILTVKEEQFASQFYALMSDTSVHPLVAEREYARLMRNMSIEYGLLLLTKLDKLGLN